jgi:hypothetical protein
MRKLVLVALAFVVTGCASMRGVDIGGNDPARNFWVEVTNQRAGTITVSYTRGADRLELGTVASQRTERFVIAAEERTSVTIMAFTSGGASAGNYPVTVEPGTTRKITVR